MKKTIIFYLSIILITIGVSLSANQTSYAFSEQVIQQGATGEDVIELQARLQYIGFYHGQAEVVEETPIEPTSVNVPNGFSQNDIQLMAQAVYGEARGEPYEGQVAVAAVILNRLQNPIFPDTVAGIIYEPLAFTAVADGQIYLTPDESSRRAVLDAINGWDPTGEATYYFNPDTATSSWIWSRPQIKQIGKHIFCD